VLGSERKGKRMPSRPLILIVDDEAHIRSVLSLKLEHAGYDVVAVENGRDGLDKALALRPDVMIVDFQMPLLTGVEMCTQLKQDSRTCDIPALMLTARGYQLGAQELEQTNIRAVLGKPFSPREVIECVETILGHASPSQGAA